MNIEIKNIPTQAMVDRIMNIATKLVDNYKEDEEKVAAIMASIIFNDTSNTNKTSSLNGSANKSKWKNRAY